MCDSCQEEIPAFPPSCMVCGALSPGAGRIQPGRTCRPCRARTALAVFLSPFSYDAPVIRRLIYACKYQRVKNAGALMGHMIAAYCERLSIRLPRDSLMIPVPLHRSRERVRGFNQAAEIARSLSGRICVPVRGDILVRTRRTRSQTRLYKSQRLANVAGAFSVISSRDVEGRVVILVDDVKTTGATLEQAGQALLRSGARQVWAITFAH